ncbi:hypothetical protein [Flavobacterium bernardetii]|uniref:DUF3997 domain-containing protein n=1 Tax=Flavobacterium bernardetii TaxID=2813823 RepID=A0ABR7J1S8_9FLAO|nr:hypothetical protein [Flavobacterium bernardetii]MBC5835898.1 hypothetical protein [Flavobacterium bernardetii]
MFNLLNIFYPKNQFSKIAENKTLYWFKSSLVISIFIFIFSFTYWGDNGVFNTYRIPLGYEREILESNDGLGHELIGCPESLGDFTITENNVCGYKATYVGDSFKTKSDVFLVWNLETNKVKVFKTQQEYTDYAKNHHLPTEENFKTFDENYSNYWDNLTYYFII